MSLPVLIVVIITVLVIFLWKDMGGSKNVQFGGVADTAGVGDSEEDRETLSCNEQLAKLRSVLADKRSELKALRDHRKKDCQTKLVTTQREIDVLQERIDNFGKGKGPKVPLPDDGNGPPAYNFPFTRTL
jgi:hypothetical protein